MMVVGKRRLLGDDGCGKERRKGGKANKRKEEYVDEAMGRLNIVSVTGQTNDGFSFLLGLSFLICPSTGR